MRHALLAPALFALLGGASTSSELAAQSAPAPSTTIILVRHAEKAAEPAADPGLTPLGVARANAGYDNAFVVTVPATGPATVVRLHYGATASCDPKE